MVYGKKNNNLKLAEMDSLNQDRNLMLIQNISNQTALKNHYNPQHTLNYFIIYIKNNLI